jgi:hypothetical protein
MTHRAMMCDTPAPEVEMHTRAAILLVAFASGLAEGCDSAPEGGAPKDAGQGGAQSSTGGTSGTGAATAGSTACASWKSTGSGAFIHPGALDSHQDLDFVKGQIQAGNQPWTRVFNLMKTSGYATRTPNGLANINSSGGDANTSRDDATGAYAQALLWYYTGNETYAQGAIAILNAWQNLQSFTAGSDQDKLQAGWIGAVFAAAAEIMRGYSGWAAADIAKLQAMFKLAFYPQLNTASSWNGNVDLTQVDAMMNMAVFNEDWTEFNLGITRWQTRNPSYFYLTSEGPNGTKIPPINGDGGNIPAFWNNPVSWIDGLEQETCRDCGHHAQFGLASALHAPEVAWNQCVDLYTAETARFTAALELLANELVTNSYTDVCGTACSPTADRYDIFEIGYNHYHNRMGIALPNTLQQITNIRAGTNIQWTSWNLVYETLTHADVP